MQTTHQDVWDWYNTPVMWIPAGFIVPITNDVFQIIRMEGNNKPEFVQPSNVYVTPYHLGGCL